MREYSFIPNNGGRSPINAETTQAAVQQAFESFPQGGKLYFERNLVATVSPAVNSKDSILGKLFFRPRYNQK